MMETWKISRTSREEHTPTTEKTDRTGFRSKEEIGNIHIKPSIYSRKTEETSRTDRQTNFQQERTQQESHPTTEIDRTSCRKVKSIKYEESTNSNEL